MNQRLKTWFGGRGGGNRRVGELRVEVRAARDRSLAPGARRRAERRVQLLAGLLDQGSARLQG